MPYLLLLFCLLLGTASSAQTPIKGYQLHQPTGSELDYHPCATPSVRSAWMRQYHQNPAAYASAKSSNTLYLPLTLHFVGNDNGTGYPDLNTVMVAFCRTNQVFASTGIQFYIQFPINYINNSVLNNHDSVYMGGALMFQYNVPNTTNCYIVSNPAGACGYNVLYGGLTVGKSCLNGTTFPHELGHAFGLQHTFFGWEGGQGHNGRPQRTFTTPAPDQVLYDYTMFKDTFWGPDTIIVDTTEVERVARTGPTANCAHAADGFCDTPADYLALGWICNSTGRSATRQLDPDSVTFFSQGTNIMSYSDCRIEFSTEQSNAMRAFAQANRSSHIGHTPITDSIDLQDLTLLSPANNDVLVGTTGHTFRWNAVPGATHYILRICRMPCTSASNVLEEIIVTDTFYTSTASFPPRNPFLPYRWRVFPFNQSFTCAGSSTYANFNTQIATSVDPIAAQALEWTISPNPVAIGQPLQLEVSANQPTDLTVSMHSITGQVLARRHWSVDHGTQQLAFPTDQLPAGVYILHLQHGPEQKTKRIVVQP